MSADRHRRFILPLTVLVVGGCISLVWRMFSMSAVSLSYVNYFAQFVLVILGAAVVAREHWPKKHPWLTIGTFVLVGGIGMFAAVRQGQQSAKETAEAQRQASEASDRLHESMDRLGKQNNELDVKTDEIKRVQGLNTELQNKLLGQSGQLLTSSKQISELSKEGIATATGGDSFCYMFLSPYSSPKGLTPEFIHQGEQPLYETRATVADLTEGLYADIDIGSLARTMVFTPANPPTFALNDPSRQYVFTVHYSARNGFWDEIILLRRVGDHWSQATRVDRQLTPKPNKVILTKIDKDFPVKKPDWSVAMGHWEKVKPLYRP